MSSLQEQVSQIPWTSLKHAYGSATDTPQHLLALLSPEKEERDRALEGLWSSICHQGSVYQASAAAVPFLIQLLEIVPDEQKPDLLDLLDGLAVGRWHVERKLVRLRMTNMGHQGWQSWGDFLREGNEYHRPEWMQASHTAVGEGIPIFLSLLHSSHVEIVRKSLILLSAFQENQEQIVSPLVAFISQCDDNILKALALRCLGNLLEELAPEWEIYQQVLALPPDQIDALVRFAAADTVAKYHPSETTPQIIELLITHLLQPYALELETLSGLGMPKGGQALIHLLERGASIWSLLDTMRVAEAVLDLAFFGAWVEGRHWQYCTRDYPPLMFKALELFGQREPASMPEPKEVPDLSTGAASFRFQYGKSSPSYPPRPDEELIRVISYDKTEAERLAQRYKQEGVEALSSDQKDALRAVLLCGPLWQYPQNLLAIYGLPVRYKAVMAFLSDVETV